MELKSLLIAAPVIRCFSLALATSPVLAASSGDATATVPVEGKQAPPQKLAPFEVTGSRIKRLDYETPAPVQTFTAQDIETKAFTNVGDFIQSQPFNSATANSIYQPLSFLRGSATTNIRGLGAQRFLTLINGRRAVPYALVSPAAGTRQVFDLNSLPAAAIESIDFLKDGASALYGADAITGVLNVKLRRNFSGLSTSLYYGNTLKGTGKDTAVREASVVAGHGSAKTRVLTAIDIKFANSNFLRDYGVASADYSYLGPVKGLNANSFSSFPANLLLTRAQAAAAGLPYPNVAANVNTWIYIVPGATPTVNPAVSSFAPAPAIGNTFDVANENRYNVAQTYQVYPAYNYISDFTSVEHEFSANLKAFAEVVYSKNSTYYVSPPVSAAITVPASNPFNPFGFAVTALAQTTLPVQKFDLEATAANVLVGLRGTVLERWDWQSGVARGFSNVSIVSRNVVRAAAMDAALNRPTRDTAFNPFGPTDASVMAGLTNDSAQTSRAEALNFDASVSGRFWNLPGGSLGVAAGMEARDERLHVNPDPAVYLGLGGGSALKGKRTVTSQYLEATAPLYQSRQVGSAELQLAGRHEHYSDFGNTTKPKIGVKFRLPETRFFNGLVRGSYSKSFQAPPLGLLHATRTVAFSPNAIQDPVRSQDLPAQVVIVQGGNPNLLPETGKVQYVGGVIEFPRVGNLSFSADFFDIRISQYIVVPSPTFLLSPAGRAQFPNAIVRNNGTENPGPIVRVEAVPSNNPLGYQLYRGLDYGVRYTIDKTRAGSFSLSADATQVIKRGTDSGLGSGFFNQAGYYYSPRWKGSAAISWNYTNCGASVTSDYIHHWFNDGYVDPGWGENPSTVVSVQLRYRLRGVGLTFGANNILNERPAENGREFPGFSPNISGPTALGRFLYVRMRRDF